MTLLSLGVLYLLVFRAERGAASVTDGTTDPTTNPITIITDLIAGRNKCTIQCPPCTNCPECPPVVCDFTQCPALQCGEVCRTRDANPKDCPECPPVDECPEGTKRDCDCSKYECMDRCLEPGEEIPNICPPCTQKCMDREAFVPHCGVVNSRCGCECSKEPCECTECDECPDVLCPTINPAQSLSMTDNKTIKYEFIPAKNRRRA